MARFIAAHSVPFTKEALKALAKEKLPEGIIWNLTYCDFADNKFFCDWEAPNKEVIEKELKVRNIPFDAVYPVQVFNVAKAELET